MSRPLHGIEQADVVCRAIGGRAAWRGPEMASSNEWTIPISPADDGHPAEMVP